MNITELRVIETNDHNTDRRPNHSFSMSDGVALEVGAAMGIDVGILLQFRAHPEKFVAAPISHSNPAVSSLLQMGQHSSNGQIKALASAQLWGTLEVSERFVKRPIHAPQEAKFPNKQVVTASV